MHITNSVIRELVNSKPEQHTFKHVSMSFYISIYTGFMYTCKDFIDSDTLYIITRRGNLRS